ncbi:hypothetical protein J6W91_00010 [Candidatus Saccharibacteria bacterium]|nr:hypothetical protein [Candidatus Saccharibacteria bacterium]
MNPEEKKNQAAPTTVGGVTFGGGNSAPQPAQNATKNTPAPEGNQGVDPIVQSTGEEFDAIMNGTAPAADPNSVVPNAMATPVASPTHFDAQNTVKPIIADPGIPGGFSRQPVNVQQGQDANGQAQAPAGTKTPEELGKQVKKVSTIAVIFGILTAVFTILAVIGLVFALQMQTENTKLESTIDTQKKIITAVEETTGVSPIDTPEKVPVYKATTGYIYLSDWNIKIKMSPELEHVSYILNNINYRQSICFNAVGKGLQRFPDFANVALNPGKMGCVTRILTNEGEFDAATGISFGEKVYTYKEYSYFYTPATDFSKTTDELGLEHTATQHIYNMLKNDIEPYE